jgi:hypothetical protein
MSAVSRVKKSLGALADSVSKRRDGSIVIRRGFYYRHGQDAESYRIAVTKKLNACDGMPYNLKDYGEHWTTFRGGASLANSSHWFVEIWPQFT